MSLDFEIRAIRDAWRAIEALNPDAQIRVVGYLKSRIGQADTAGEDGGVVKNEINADWRIEFAKWLSSENAAGYSDWILVSAALLQRQNPTGEFTARQIHQPIKDSGRSVNNISAHLKSLVGRRNPKWVIQTRQKGGKNGHKRYAVTDEGINEAEKLLRVPAALNEAPSCSGAGAPKPHLSQEKDRG